MRRLFPGLALLLTGPLPAAVTPPVATLVATCEQSSADHEAFGLCLQEAALEWNLVLHERYAGLRESLTGDPARRLLTSQRSFVRYRDLHCTALAGLGRERDQAVWQACNLRVTLQRIDELFLYPDP